MWHHSGGHHVGHNLQRQRKDGRNTPSLLLHIELPASLVDHDLQGITTSLWKAYSSYAMN